MVDSESALFDLYDDRVELPGGSRTSAGESVEHGPRIDIRYPPGVDGPYKVGIQDWTPPPTTASGPDSPRWGTYRSPEQLREAAGQLGTLRDFIDAFTPPNLSDPNNPA